MKYHSMENNLAELEFQLAVWKSERVQSCFFIFLEYISMYRIVLLIVARIILVILDDC